MDNKLKPTRYYKDIYSINYELLKQENIKYLLFDLDNTIGDSREKTPSEKAIKLFKELKKDFVPIIITNALPGRTKRYAEALNVDAYYLSSKPRKRNYLKIIEKYNINIDQAVCIGDQIYTDIIGANNLGIKSIFLDRLSKYESVLSKPNRIKEKVLVYKREVIKRGEYYE